VLLLPVIAAGRLDEAVAECSRALALEPDFAFGHYVLAGAYLKQKRYDNATREAMAAWELGRDPRSLVRAGLSEAAAGRMDTAPTSSRGSSISPASGSCRRTRWLRCSRRRGEDARVRLQRTAVELPPGQYQRLVASDPLLAPLR
jgi:tetratricopeptide (TPR) repeat protein